jgi:hypothetical protein
MKHKHITTKIWEDTLPKLRMIYAITGESMVAILDRVVTKELERIQKEKQQSHADPESL